MVTVAESSSSTQVALLHRISSIVSSDQDIESILHEMVMLTMNVTHSDACLVYLIDHTTNEIVLRASQLPHDAEIGKVRHGPMAECGAKIEAQSAKGRAKTHA